MKVFPQEWVGKVASQGYDFAVWVDHKYNVRVDAVRKTAASWDPKHALLMLRHPFLCGKALNCGAHEEFRESMHQERYRRQRDRYKAYMWAEENAGFPSSGHRHFTCCFLMYSLRHADCAPIQNMWMEHIERCGIQDQISMYYVAQRFPKSIAEFRDCAI